MGVRIEDICIEIQLTPTNTLEFFRWGLYGYIYILDFVEPNFAMLPSVMSCQLKFYRRAHFMGAHVSFQFLYFEVKTS